MKLEPILTPKPYTLAYYKEILLNLKLYFQLAFITDEEGYSYFKDGLKGIVTTLKVGILGQPIYYKMVSKRKRKNTK
jgi:hypothetical protein